MKKIAFVFLREPKIEPLGVMYLGAVAKQCGCDVGYFTGDCQELIDFAPDFIGYSIMTGDQEAFRQLNSKLKNNLGTFESVVGGPHATFFPDDLRWADYVCAGEGEAWLAEFLAYGSPLHQDRIDTLPWPDRFMKNTISDFITSRGCPYSCTYCYNSKFQEITGLPKVRTRSAEDVVNEIKAVVFANNSKFVYFQDDCFGINTNWLERFAELYNSSIPYHCHVRTELITPKRVDLLKKSGCRSVHMAVECADINVRKYLLDRKMNNKSIRDAAWLLNNAGIAIMTQSIIGLPGVSIDDDLETLKFNIELNPAYAWCSIYQPYPGTILGEHCRKHGLWDGDVSKIGSSFFETSRLNYTPEHIHRLEVLQKLFAYFVQEKTVPSPDFFDLMRNKGEFDVIYNAVREDGDKKLFGEEIVKSWN